MPVELLRDAASLGIAGLLFVMWWLERQERGRHVSHRHDVGQYAAQLGELNRNLLDIVRANTEALAALREELRSHRTSEMEVLARLARRLDDLE